MKLPATLSVEVRQAHSKQAKQVAAITADLVKSILDQLGYEKEWTISLIKQISKKNDFKFQVTSRRGTAIICRTKPGDNSTAWEIMLIPPKGYLVDQIFNDLKTVPESGKMIKTPLSKKLNILDVNPKLPTPIRLPLPPIPSRSEREQQKPFIVPLEKEIPVQTKPVEIPVKIPEQVVQIVPEKESLQIVPEKESPQIISVEDEALFIKDLTGLRENSLAMRNGLVALCYGMSINDHAVLRKEAIQILIQELGLIEFVKNNTAYTDPVKVATTIINGLTDNGHISRWHHPQQKGKTKRVRDTTKGYLLTPMGRAFLDQHKDKLPEFVKNKLFHPENIVFKNIPEEKIETKNPTTEDKSSLNIDEIAPIFKEFQDKTKALEEIDLLTNDYLSKKAKIEETRDHLNEKMIQIDKEIAEKIELLKKQKDELVKQTLDNAQKHQEILNDLRTCESLKQEESDKLKEIRIKLKEIIS